MSTKLAIPTPTWFVGCGNMGGAILDGWRMGGLDLSAVTVIRPSGKPLEGARVVTSFRDAGPPPKFAFLAFKPQKLDQVAPELRLFLSARTTLVSLLAGAEVMSLRQRFPGVGTVVRATTNLPVAVRRGVSGLYSPDSDSATQQELNDLFSALGFTMWMADEQKLGAVGAVAGAGPAYVARFISALEEAGVEQGLSREIASTLAVETALGTAWMAATTGESMDSVAKRVASPKGTTQAGLDVLDTNGALEALVATAIEAAVLRGSELAEDAKSATADARVEQG